MLLCHRFVALLILLCSLWIPMVVAQSTVVDVYAEVVALKEIETKIEALGSVRAFESVNITSNVTKTIHALHFDDGQQVKAGELLVSLSSNEEEALLSEAKFTFTEASKQRERIQSLVKRQAASESLLDQQVREQDAAGARVAALEARLKDLRIVAPFNGVVGLRQLSVGSLVTPGTVITTLNDEHQMKLDFTVPVVFLRYLAPGLQVVARSMDLTNESYQGKILSIDNQIDSVTRSIAVRALLPNVERDLKQGMLMKVELIASPREVIFISEAALVPLGAKNFVFVIKQHDSTATVERREVKIAQRLQGGVEIESGLVAGEKIVTHGLQKIRDGQPVNVLAVQQAGESVSSVLTRIKQEG